MKDRPVQSNSEAQTVLYLSAIPAVHLVRPERKDNACPAVWKVYRGCLCLFCVSAALFIAQRIEIAVGGQAALSFLRFGRFSSIVVSSDQSEI